MNVIPFKEKGGCLIDIIAHRGLRHERPENTLDSIAAALELPGIHGIEFDVELTGDGAAVVLHQETVVPDAVFKRVEPAVRDHISRDWVIEASAREVSNLDAGSWMGLEFSHLKVPKLSEVLGLPWKDTVAYVELKDATYWGKRDSSRPTQVVKAVLPEISAFPGELNVISFNPEILRVLGERASHIPRTLALWTEWRSRAFEATTVAQQCGASTISLPDLLVIESPEWVRAAHEQNLKIHVYPVSPALGEPEFLNWTAISQVEKWRATYDLGVDAILSDFGRETLAHFSTETSTRG